MKIAAKQLQMDTLLLLTAYRKSPLQRPIQWYHRRPPTTYRLATIHPLRRPSVTRIDESKTVQAKITKSSPSAARKTGQQRYNNDFYGGTAIWCFLAQVSFNLENRDLDGRNLRSILKISYAVCPCLSQLISAQFALQYVSQPEIAKNQQKPLFWCSRSSKVIEFGTNREPVYDFLLVIGPISHRYWDTTTYWLKIANFSYPPLI